MYVFISICQYVCLYYATICYPQSRYEPWSQGPSESPSGLGWGGVEEPCPVPWGHAHLLHTVRVSLGRGERKPPLKPVRTMAESFTFFWISYLSNGGLLFKKFRCQLLSNDLVLIVSLFEEVIKLNTRFFSQHKLQLSWVHHLELHYNMRTAT